MPSIYKVEWDRDYHTVSSKGWINSADDVEDSWSGYNYRYYTDSERRNSVSADEARRILKGEQTDPRFDCSLHIVGSLDGNRSVGVELRVRSKGCQQNLYTVKGESAALVVGALAGTTPIGILFDRLEEFPNEIPDCPPDTLRACIQYLRSKYPDGR